jgi:diacylglycerol kinase family enzyme
VSVAGEGLGILVNANAKRGGRRVAAEIARALPGANVRLTRNAEEVDAWLRSLCRERTRAILPAGGDGTAVALVNSFARVFPDEPFPRIGILRLGTGNAWAHATGAPKLDRALRLVAATSGALPLRRFGVIRCDGTLTPFAGAGWEAEVLNDYRTQVALSKGPAKWLSKSAAGYVGATLFRTAPKALVNGRPQVLIENLGEDVYTISADRKLMRLHGVGHGAVLYDGMASVAGCSISPELGYHFRAYPFAERYLGMMNVRVYDETTVGAVSRIPRIWRGEHPLRGMHDWFATKVRMTFSRPVPLQIGGDAVGYRQTVEFEIGPREIELVDWRGF